MEETTDVTVSIAGGPLRAPVSALRLPHLTLVLECERPLAGGARLVLADLHELHLGRGNARSFERLDDDRRKGALRVPDLRMSANHAVLCRRGDEWWVLDRGSKNGCILNGLAVEEARLADGDTLELGQTFFRFGLGPWGPDLPEWLDDPHLMGQPEGLRTLHPALALEFSRLTRMARSPVPVVITGPSGTGKEMVARSIHTLSERRGAYVPVNCAAIAPTLLESELFGHKKGAFSGAQEDRPGLLRAAHEGTLFLDEIADMPLPAQAAVLRALQEGEVLPVGSTRAVPVQLRVLSATHGHLEKLAEEGKFRSDLRARLSGFAVDLPALRARREDMGLLISALLRRSKVPGASTATIAPAVMRCVLAYDWPLNVRELEKVLTSALVLAAGSRVEWDHLPAAVQSSRAVVHGSRLAGESAWPSSHASSTDVRGAVPVASERDGTVPREFLQERLRFHHGNVSAVARELGKARMQIQRWIRRYSIDVEAMRS